MNEKAPAMPTRDESVATGNDAGKEEKRLDRRTICIRNQASPYSRAAPAMKKQKAVEQILSIAGASCFFLASAMKTTADVENPASMTNAAPQNAVMVSQQPKSEAPKFHRLSFKVTREATMATIY